MPAEFRTLLIILISIFIVFSAGCATVGHDFPVDQVNKDRNRQNYQGGHPRHVRRTMAGRLGGRS